MLSKKMKRKATQELKRSTVKRRKYREALGNPYPQYVKQNAVEMKNSDQINNAVVTNAQTTANKFLLLVTDDVIGINGRVGRRITMKNISVKWTGSLAATTAGASPLRLLIVYDKQTNAATPATNIICTDAIYGPMNLSYSRRFKVLVDEIVECVGTQGPAAFHRNIFRDFTAKGTKAGLEAEFNDSGTNDITSITTGAIFALVWQNGKLITADPQCDLYTRIRYVDL